MDNISAVFGTKQVFDLLQITPTTELDDEQIKSAIEESEPSSSSELIDDLSEEDLKRFTIDGWISSCHHGSGRSSKDRQFIYINSRPCEPKKILKIINEMYSRYNSNQNPFVYLNIIVKRSDVDVNITPDKRQLLLHNENLLLLVLKACLSKTFSNVPSVYKMQNVNLSTNKTENTPIIDTAPNPTKFSQMLAQWKKTGQTNDPCSTEKIVKRKVVDEVEIRNQKMRKIHEFLTQKHDDTVPMSDDETLSSSIDQSIIDKSQLNQNDSIPRYLRSPESSSTPERQCDLKVERKSVSESLEDFSDQKIISFVPSRSKSSIRTKVLPVHRKRKAMTFLVELSKVKIKRRRNSVLPNQPTTLVNLIRRTSSRMLAKLTRTMIPLRTT